MMGNLLQRLDLSPYHEHSWVKQYWMPYYQSLTIREKWVVRFAAVCIPLILFFFLLILPLHDAQSNKLSAMQTLQTQALEAESLALRLRSGNNRQVSESIMTIVDQVARQVKVRKFITRLRPKMGLGKKQRLLIQMRHAPYAQTVQFLARLSKLGLELLQVKLQKTTKPAYVDVQFVIE